MAYNLEKDKIRAVIFSILSNSFLIIGKLIVGIFSGSVAIISEAIHSGIDLIAALMAYVAIKFSNAPPDSEHPFGHGKAESIAALFEALLIIGAGLFIIKSSIEFLINPREVNIALPAISIMLLSAISNFFVSSYLFKVGKRTESTALMGDAWHLRTDVYTSLGILFSLLAIWVGSFLKPDLNLNFLDPLSAIVVACLILKTGFKLTFKSISDLLDISLPDKELKLIKKLIQQEEPQIKGFNQLKTRKSGPNRFIEFDLLFEANLTIKKAHDLTVIITKNIQNKFPRSQVVIHIEPTDDKND